jgi:hypothetical protein
MIMKTTLLSVALVISFLAASSALACDQGKCKEKTSKKATTTAVDKKEKTASTTERGGELLTGSYIKQRIHRAGHITDGVNQVIVVDRDMIERSGASDVKQLLNRQGVH